MKLRAHAKLNLSLRVFDKRADGFHNLESVMQSISLHDLVTLSVIPSGIEVVCDDHNVPQGAENIVYKAAKLVLEQGNRRTGEQERGINIHIEKRIPMAAGLAGGSADAAAVLYGLNRLLPHTSQLIPDELLKLGAQVGSDVPFCLTGGTCLVKGRGESVAKQQPWPRTYFVLVCPDIHVSTKWAYEEFDRMHLAVFGAIKNDLEPVVVSQHEVITEIKEKLLKLGASESQMSGSGPSVYGIFRHKNEADQALQKIKDEYPRSFLAEAVDSGLEIIDNQ